MKLFLISTFLVMLCFLGVGQGTPYHYTIPGVAPGDVINCLEQDESGRLLVGTEKGALSYTGFRSNRIPLVGSVSNDIVVLSTTSNGKVVFAANRAGQFFELRDGRFVAQLLPEFVGDIRQIHVVNGEIKIIGSKFISWYSYPGFKFLEYHQIPFTEPQGTIANWVTTFKDREYAVLNSGELVEIDDASSRSLVWTTGKSIVGFNGKLAIIPSYVANEPVFSYLNGGFINYGSLLGWGAARVNGAKVIGNQLFILSENGLFVYTNGLTRRPAQWFQRTNIISLLADKKGNLWIGTRGKGMYFVPAGRHDIVYPGSLISLQAGPDNTFFGGMLDGSIARFDMRGKIVARYTNPSVSLDPHFLAYDSFGNLLFSNTGVFSISRGRALSPNGESVKAIARDKNGGVYMAKTNGVVYIPLNRKKPQFYGLTDSTKIAVWRREPARSVVINEKGEVAMSTVSGVFLIRHNQLQEQKYDNQSIDAQQILWKGDELLILTSGNQLLSLKDGRIKLSVQLTNKIGDAMVNKVQFYNGYLYLLTESGLYRMAEPKSPLESLKDLMGFDGLIVRDFTAIGDYIYVATQKGVMRFVWKKQQAAEFSLLLKQIRGKIHSRPKRKKNGTYIFPADEEMIVIPFECIDLTRSQPFLVQYAVYEEGEKRVWNELPASSQQVSLTHLGPGEYIIDFRLVDPATGIKTDIQTRKFILRGYWYKSTWFITLTIVVVAAGIGFAWRWSIRRERKRLSSN